ncbi:MAG: RpiB/LacA/LacB family sugar-phosphate isomerase [Planctomycetes bacterium]|nr:RpiB/LacA/LacB family sugar-phosphate isomerase [Planctomycetota bacterium]MCB9902769.1 RpiB/LacA/LacB family sugar-phosphate isomerase [Planctomycetota bacterium]
MLVAIGADHGGYERKNEVGRWLVAMGHRVLDLGTHDGNAVDYPDYARAVAEAVAEGRADLGICVDGAGIGSAMAANKVPGVLAATCTCVPMAQNAREHNFANVLCLGSKLQTSELHEKIVRAFLTTPEGALRHEKRVRKILEIERRYTRVGRELTRVRPGGENA